MLGNLNFTVETKYRHQFVKRFEALNLNYLENSTPHECEFMVSAHNEAELSSLEVLKTDYEAFNRRLQTSLDYKRLTDEKALEESKQRDLERENLVRRLTFRKPLTSV